MKTRGPSRPSSPFSPQGASTHAAPRDARSRGRDGGNREGGGREGSARDGDGRPYAQADRAHKPRPDKIRPDRAPERTDSARTDGARAGGERAGARRPAPQPGVLYGVHAVAAAWTNPRRRCRALHATPAGLKALESALAQAQAAGLPRPAPTLRERDELDALLPPGAVHQGLVLDANPLPESDLADIIAQAGERDVLLMLDQVTDPHNVGAILRSAAAFGVRAVIVQDRHAPEVTGVLGKTACGALEVVPMTRETNLSRALDALRDAGFWCVGLAEEGPAPLHALADQGSLDGRVVLVLGSEGDGLRRLVAQRCDALAHLPTKPPIGSLNVSNAAAVALYELARRRV